MKYLDEYKELHNQLEGYGGGGALSFHSPHIVELVKDCNAKTLLDFGCGKANYEQHKIHESWGGILPSLYDPAIPEYETLPEEIFDGVFCVDVMEHIPEEEIDGVLTDIYSKANKFVFLGISTEPAKTILPNGENAHCTVENADWWEQRVSKVNTKGIYTHMNCYGWSNDYKIMCLESFLCMN